MVRQLLARRGLSANYDNLQAINEEIVQTYGDDYISFMFEFIKAQGAYALIDAFRRIADINCISREYGTPTLVEIKAPAGIRYERMIARARLSDPIDKAAFADLAKREDSWGVDALCELADITIINTGLLPETRMRVIEAFATIISTA